MRNLGLNWIGALFDRIFAVIFAVLFAQAPLFIQQYTQQLIGREAELRLQVEAMRVAARHSGKTLEQLIEKFRLNPDMDIQRQGGAMQALVYRWQELSEALSALLSSSSIERPFSFVAHLNGETFKSTMQQFSMGLPLNVEGGCYAFAGITFGYLFFAILRKIGIGFVNLCKAPFRKAQLRKS